MTEYLWTRPLGEPDGVPDAGEPVGHQGEGRHEEDEDGGAVLRVSVNLPRHPHQAEQAGGLQEADQCCGLKTKIFHIRDKGKYFAGKV